MENAAKALTIAGGVLISIIVISTLVFSFQQWGILPKAQDESKAREEVLEFNKDFESYNKKNLYGADVLTVLSKAIDNNKKYGIEDNPDDPYYVDVSVEFKTNVHGYEIKYITQLVINTEGKIVKDSNIEGPNKTEPPLISGGHTYELSNPSHYRILERLQAPDKAMSVKTHRFGNKTTRTETYPAEVEFRVKKYFTCIGIEKNEISGRISKISFKEITEKELSDQNGQPLIP